MKSIIHEKQQSNYIDQKTNGQEKTNLNFGLCEICRILLSKGSNLLLSIQELDSLLYDVYLIIVISTSETIFWPNISNSCKHAI